MPLDFERITLNAIPDGDMPVFHASQFETMRPFIADLKWGTEDFAPGEGNWCTLSIRKTDDTLVIIDDIDIDNNTVSCILSQQAVACFGDNFCQLKVWGTENDEDGCIACLNFILHVQPDPEAGGLTSESEINNLTQQIETIAQEVIGEDYYNKTEVDGLISGVESQIPTKTSDLTNDSGFITSAALTPYAKTADLATVATTGDYDDLLNKPTIPDAQVQSDWEQADNTKVDYIKNKPDIDAMIADALLAVMPVGTESGPIASFDTEIAAPLVNVSCDIVATGGNGTPDNPNPINGYSEANITRCGVNLIQKQSGMQLVNVVSGTTLYFRLFNSNANFSLYGLPVGLPDIVSNWERIGDFVGQTLQTETTTNDYSHIGISASAYSDLGAGDIQISLSSFDTFTPYNGDTVTIAFGQTVYGGVLDVTRGKLNVNSDRYDFNGTEGWNLSGTSFFYYSDSAMSPRFKNNTFVTANNGIIVRLVNNYQFRVYIDENSQFIDASTDMNTIFTNATQLKYELDTPIDIDLTPEVISAIVGTNNVYSDTNGDTTVQYKDSIQHYIDTRV